MEPDPNQPALESGSSAVEGLVVEFLDRSETEGPAVLEELCARDPERAPMLRSRVAALQRAGLLQPFESERIPERLGEFRVLDRVGGGGMGVVYRATQESLGRVVALKVLRPELLWFAGARDRFRREAEAVARLAHPAIVPLYSFGEADGVPYLAMEYVRGVSLSAIVARLRTRDPASLTGDDLLRALAACLGPGPGPRGDPLYLYAGTWSEACARIGASIARALDHAHERGVLHRDLKPSNVMLAEDGRVLLIDFGLAAREGADRLTRTGSHLGSLPYMSPEQVEGHADRIGVRSDVYGLAVTLYEILALRLPYDSESAHEIMRRVASGDAAPIRAGNVRVPRDLETVIAKAMDVRPELRYATAAAFAHDLQNFIERRPIVARRSGPLRHAWSWTRRHPAAASAIALGMVVFVGGPIGFAIQQSRALDELAQEAGRTAQATRLLQVALDRAESNFTQALDAVALLTRVGEDRLAEVPGAGEARRELLEGALNFHSRLADQRRGDPAFAGELARTELRVGEILAALGRHDEAELVFASVQQVAETNPSVLDDPEEDFLAPRAAMLRARSLESLGRSGESASLCEDVVSNLSRHQVFGAPVAARELLLDAWKRLQEHRRSTGDERGSIVAQETRSQLCAQLYEEFPTVLRYGVEVAECYAAVALQDTRFALALEPSDAGRENRDNLIKFTDNILPALRAAREQGPESADLLARVLTVRALALAGLSRRVESVDAWREIVDMRRAAWTHHPGLPVRARALASALANLAAMQNTAGDVDGAVASHDEAIRLRAEAVAANPGDTKQRAGLGVMRLNKALGLMKLHRSSEASDVLLAALADLRAHQDVEPADPFVRDRIQQVVFVRGTLLLEEGRGEDARDQLAELAEVTPRMRINFARVWARTAALCTGGAVAECKERALVLLETASGGDEAPAHLDSGDFAELRADPRFVAAASRLRP